MFTILFFSRHKLFENETLQNRLNEEMQNNRTYENRLMISKTQVVQLEKQLFALNLAPSNVINSYYVTHYLFY